MDNQQAQIPTLHESIGERLPWFASGAIRGAERAAIEAHLGACELCRRQLELERETVTLLEQSAPAPGNPEPGLSRLLARIGTAEPTRHRAPAGNAIRPWFERLRVWCHGVGWSPALAGGGVFALALGISVTTWFGSSPVARPESGYHVLSGISTTAPAAENDIHLVLAPTMDDARRQVLLEAVGGRIVGRKNSIGAITVRIDTPGGRADVGAALQRLRLEPDVLLAESAVPNPQEAP
jgi:hypothetical protein